MHRSNILLLLNGIFIQDANMTESNEKENQLLLYIEVLQKKH